MKKQSDKWGASGVLCVVVAGLSLCLALLLLALVDPSILWVVVPSGCVFLAFGLLATRGALLRWSPDDKVNAAARRSSTWRSAARSKATAWRTARS